MASMYIYILRSKMESIHCKQEYEREYKEQFGNMTDKQIEQHIGLEKVRNTVSLTVLMSIMELIKSEKSWKK